MKAAASLHPASLAVYFAAVLLITMFAAVPSVTVIALFGGICLSAMLAPPTKPLSFYGSMALLLVVVTLTNPLFSHHGATVLFFFNRNPVTLEALLYGAHLGCMLTATLLWFRALSVLLTEDKLLVLFSGISPRLALLLSMALRLVPLLKSCASALRDAQRALGAYASPTWSDRLKTSLRVYSALVTWSLEKAVDTGASMKARGYGLRGRSRHAPCAFRMRDALWLTAVAVCGGIVTTALVTRKLSFSFYPTLQGAPFGGAQAIILAAFALLCALPLILELKEVLSWQYSLSKM